jgi:hypothetical protein
MPPRRLSQHLSQPGDEALPQPSTENQPPTQNLPSITEGLEHATFTNTEEVKLHHATNNNTSTAAAGSSQNARGTGSIQSNGGVSHQSPLWALSPIQVIQEHVELEQLQVEDWEDEVSEDEAIEEAKVARVQQEIGRLHQEHESIIKT